MRTAEYGSSEVRILAELIVTAVTVTVMLAALAWLALNRKAGYFCSDPVTFTLRPRKPLNSHHCDSSTRHPLRLHAYPLVRGDP